MLREWCAIPCDMRHGAAPHATTMDGMDLNELQARVRHVSAQSTARTSRHVRYLAQLQKVPAVMVRRAELTETVLTMQSWNCSRSLAEPGNPSHHTKFCTPLRTKCRWVANSFLPKSVLASVRWQSTRTCMKMLVLYGCLSKCSLQEKRAWQRMILRWIASRLVRCLFSLCPSSETMSGVPSLLRICRSALQVRCPCMYDGGATRPCPSACKCST